MRTIKSVISDHPLLRTMQAPHLEVLAGCGQDVTFLPGQLLFRQGEPADRFYLILEGRVSVEAHDPAGADVSIQTLAGGDLLGWSWLFQPFVWHFQARALEPISAVAFDGAHLLIACESNHDLGYELIKRFAQVLIHRLQATRKTYLETLGQSRQPATSSMETLRV